MPIKWGRMLGRVNRCEIPFWKLRVGGVTPQKCLVSKAVRIGDDASTLNAVRHSRTDRSWKRFLPSLLQLRRVIEHLAFCIVQQIERIGFDGERAAHPL